ncbi:hypothetical protein PZT57_26360 [Pseudomonas aeruginosa]|uniref:hypothetical protein n=1 Tax=Pseudomonas aeruginosa TaxID=287 RepID=UPI002B2780C0|nr:hypothetical protein [Pseudomonas aeruginosa]MEA8592172.1 hypothetical protein [Pseudomonas aeruginosa]
MLEHDGDEVDRWSLYMVIGFLASKRKFTLFTKAALLPATVAFCVAWAFAPYQSLLLPSLLTLGSVALGTLLIAVIRILPREGLEYLELIEARFGPKTRAEVWQWYQVADQTVILDVVKIAREVGEYGQIGHASAK